MSVIRTYGDKATEDLHNGVSSSAGRRFKAIASVATRKLDYLDAANDLNDLRSPPGNHLEVLKGDFSGFHSIRINDQFRIVFKWTDGAAHEVQIVDYH